MISWHIFRKDWRLLWPLALAVALLQLLVMGVIRHSDPFPLPDARSGVAAMLTFGLAVAMTLLIVLTIQQEAIPSINQDWLTRPVKRRDLLLGKLLTIGLLIHGPIVVVNVLQGLGEGFDLGPILLATFDSNFEVALCYSLPAMAIAAMTKSVVEAIIFGLVVLVVCVSIGVASPPTGGTGFKWIWRSVAHAELLLVTFIALWWQYSRRSRDGTQQARALFAIGVVLFALLPLLPWGPAFSIQRWFAANPQASRAIAIAVERGEFDSDTQVLKQKEIDPQPKGMQRIALPLRFTGVPAGVIVHVDRTIVRLLSGDGTEVYRGLGRVFDLPADGAATVQQFVDVPYDLYVSIRERPAQLELEYFATLLRGKVVSTSVPLDDARRLPGFGWCATHTDANVHVGCRQIGALPFCISAKLGRVPEAFVCELNYEPVPLRFSVDPIDHVEVTLRMPQADDPATEVAIQVYEPEDHFSRKVRVRGVRLQDWRLPPPADNPLPLTQTNVCHSMHVTPAEAGHCQIRLGGIDGEHGGRVGGESAPAAAGRRR